MVKISVTLLNNKWNNYKRYTVMIMLQKIAQIYVFLFFVRIEAKISIFHRKKIDQKIKEKKM